MRRKKKLEDVLPIYKIENDYLLSRQGDITLAFELLLPEIFTLSTNDYEALHAVWVKAIRLLPIYSLLHKQDWFIKATYEADFSNPDTSFLSKCSELHFNERPYLSHKCYLYITQRPASRKPTSALGSTLISSRLVPSQTIDTRELNAFMDKVGQFVKILKRTNKIFTMTNFCYHGYPFLFKCFVSYSSVRRMIFWHNAAISAVCFSSLKRYAAAFFSEKWP